jgi:hypothetical protein
LNTCYLPVVRDTARSIEQAGAIVARLNLGLEI